VAVSSLSSVCSFRWLLWGLVSTSPLSVQYQNHIGFNKYGFEFFIGLHSVACCRFSLASEVCHSLNMTPVSDKIHANVER
jgi:hypothetical protein